MCLVQWQNGTRFQLSLDEGIYLEGAERVAQGQAPYRDFFAFTGPGTFWCFGAIFRAFGASLAVARLVLSTEIALMCTAIYWLLAGLASRGFALAMAAVFVTFCLDSPGYLYVSHRWDSNTWALAALVLACTGVARVRRAYWIGAGACAAIAAWITPPFVIVVALVAACSWRRWGDYLAGVAVPSIAAAAVLIHQHAVGAMIEQLRWAVTHYGAPNRVPYGYLVGGPLANLRSLEYLTPAILPVAAYLGLLVLLFVRRRQINSELRSDAPVEKPVRGLKSRPTLHLEQDAQLVTLLVCFSAGVLIAGLPRLGAHQLLFLSPVFWILCGYVLFHCISERWRWLVIQALVVMAGVLLASSIGQNRAFSESVETNAGEVRCTPADAKLVTALQDRINPGDSLFVFPYLPILYFVTGGQNPSRYSFLQPGMMTDQDEAAAVAELAAHPPRWMLWAQFPPGFWLSVWPKTDTSRLQFPSLEAFMQNHYREVLRVQFANLTLTLAGIRQDRSF